jgi:hypothetical protein
MSYERTEVAVAKSQESLRKLIMSHKGFGWAAVSQRDPDGKESATEGFQAQVIIDGAPYRIRLSAKLKRTWTEREREQEERRIWRVLYHQMKADFEASDSGVTQLRERLLPYMVMPDGRTVSEIVLPKLAALASGNSKFLLTDGNEDRTAR